MPAPRDRRGHPGPRAPCLCADRGAGTLARRATGTAEIAKMRESRGHEGRRPAQLPIRRVKKKKVEKEAFQVKLLGSEKTRLREMTRGGRTHGVQGTLASTGWAHRGCTAAAPRPGQQALAHVERRGTG